MSLGSSPSCFSGLVCVTQIGFGVDTHVASKQPTSNSKQQRATRRRAQGATKFSISRTKVEAALKIAWQVALHKAIKPTRLGPQTPRRHPSVPPLLIKMTKIGRLRSAMGQKRPHMAQNDAEHC